MGKVLCFIYDKMADFEVTLACHLLEKEVVPIAYEYKNIESESGLNYYPKLTVKEALELDGVEGLLIPGGANDEQRDELTKLIKKLNSEKKLLAAICAGPQYLASAGVLDNRKYTTSLDKEILEEYFNGKSDPFDRRNFVSKNVVRDENIITAVGNAFVDFAIEVNDYLGGYASEEEKIEACRYRKGL